MEVQQQKEVVDNISQQVSLANNALTAATLGLTQAESQEVSDMQSEERLALVKSIFDPLGVGLSLESAATETPTGRELTSPRMRLSRAQQKAGPT